MANRGMTVVQRVPAPEPRATIDTNSQSRRDQAAQYGGASLDDDPNEPENALGFDTPISLMRLMMFAQTGSDISDLLEPGQVATLGADAIRQWEVDKGTRARWLEVAERSLAIAAQETDDDGEKDFPFENASDIHYPLLTTSSQQFAARAAPALIKGDKVVGVKTFTPPMPHQPTLQVAKAGPQPQNDEEAQLASQVIQGQQQQDQQHDLELQARAARAERVKQYLNWTIFYKMDDWQGETDQLLHEIPVTGAGFKKIYMGTTGLCSDYVSALRLTVHNDTKSMARCPRITQDFDVYPYEIENRKRAGIYRDVEIPNVSQDPEAPRLFIEQHTMADLDRDGLPEPYILTMDVDSRQVMRVEPAYGVDDIIINEQTGRVIRIDRWRAFSSFLFLPDPRGRFYGIGFGKLLESIMDSIDTSMNQLIDAGTAEIAGGGFIGAGVRLQGSGQGGSIFFRPGEYQTVSTQGPDLRQAVWERTIPHPSEVTIKLLELLLAAAKDITSVKDVITGNTPATAPVGTTMALQDQALQTFSAIYRRLYRGFADEFRLMYLCLKRFATDRERKEYAELTLGDFDKDFKGDGTDIMPVADPTVVTKMQKIARIQTLIQFAESVVGQAAGMTQAGPAQEIANEVLEATDWDRPERFVAPVPPNPILEARAADMQATAQLKQVDAETKAATAPAIAQEKQASATLAHSKALREIGLAAKDTHDIHAAANHMERSGQIHPISEGADPNGPPLNLPEPGAAVLTSPAVAEPK